jgi:hypothetical protein
MAYSFAMDLSRSIMDPKYVFWEDNWLGNATLREQYPTLYNIVCHKSDTIVAVMATSPPTVSFRRDLIGPQLTAWNALLQCLASVQLMPGTDEFRWSLHANGTFSVDSLYKAIIQSDMPINNNKKIWKMKMPLKTKVFCLAKRNWHGNRSCVFCHQDETIKHLFF